MRRPGTAFPYNHTGGHVTVSSGTANGHAFLRVVNTGPSVTPDKAQRLFEPFVRGAANGTHGTGLGLSIVRAVVTAHDGEISSTARPTGGMDIAVHLPQALEPVGCHVRVTALVCGNVGAAGSMVWDFIRSR